MNKEYKIQINSTDEGKIQQKKEMVYSDFVNFFMYFVKFFRMISLTAVLFACLIELGVFASFLYCFVGFALIISYMFLSWKNLQKIEYDYFYDLWDNFDIKKIDYKTICVLFFCLLSAVSFHIEILYIFLPFVSFYNFYMIDYAVAFSCIFSHLVIMYNYASKNIIKVLDESYSISDLIKPFGFVQLIFIISCFVYPSSLFIYILFYSFIGLDLLLKINNIFTNKDTEWNRYFIFYILLVLFVVAINFFLVNDLLFAILAFNSINLVSILHGVHKTNKEDDILSSASNLFSFIDNLFYFLGYYFLNKVLLIFHACMDSVLPVLFFSLYFPPAFVLCLYPLIVMSNMFYMNAETKDLSDFNFGDYSLDVENKDFKPYLGFIFILSFVFITISFSILEALVLLACISVANYLLKNYDGGKNKKNDIYYYIFKGLDVFMHLHESLHIMEHLDSFCLIRDEVVAVFSVLSSVSLISKGNCCGGYCDYKIDESLICEDINARLT